MIKQLRFFVGTLSVTIGEYKTEVNRLIVAVSKERAWVVLEQAATLLYGNGNEPKEDDGYYTNHGEIHTKAQKLHEIGLASFLELRMVLNQSYDEDTPGHFTVQTEAIEGFKAFSASVARTLEGRGIKVPHLYMLDALAKAFGQKNWQILREKLGTVKPLGAGQTGRGGVRHSSNKEPF